MRDPGRPANTYLIKGAFTTDHECLPCCKPLKDMGHLLGQIRVIDPHNLCRGSCRVGQGTQQIKDGTDPYLPSWSGGVFHGTIKQGGIEKADPYFLNASFHVRGVNI